MPSHDQAAAAALVTVAMAWDGVLAGLALAFFAAQTWARYHRSSSALGKIRRAPSGRISDLRSILSSDEDSRSSSSSPGTSSSPGVAKLVIIRGEVQTRWAAGSQNKGALVSQGSGERAVIVQRTSTCLYSEWRGIFGWSIDLHAIFAETWKDQHSSSLRTVPFILVEDGQWPHAGFINVKLEGSAHPLPLTTVYHQLLPVQATTYTFFQATFGHGYPVALLDEEKILPVGKEITAMGVCSLQDGVLEIKPSEELPFFLSNMTKDAIEADLAMSVNVLFRSGILLGAFSVGILGYAVARNWRRLKEWRNRRRLDRESRASTAETIADDDDSGETLEGALCVICLTRRRRCAFLPCGHFVCCFPCAAVVDRDSTPKCPVCRQSTQSFIRIYDF